MNDTEWPYRDKRGRVRLTIWRNISKDGTRSYSTEVYRRYNAAKDGQPDDWKTTYKMQQRDLTDAARLYDIADQVITKAEPVEEAA